MQLYGVLAVYTERAYTPCMNNDRPRRLRGWADWGISAINGALGDYLHERGNGLAIDMAFYQDGRRLPLTATALRDAYPDATARVCILVHGLGCNEGTWLFPDPARPDTRVTYGDWLRRDLGYTPFYVRYNTGLSIANNGRRLVALLDTWAAVYPAPLEEIILIGHSMGGLVLRAMCHLAAERDAAWLDAVRHIFYLGTPHDGATLARLGHWTVTALHAVPNPVTRLVGNAINRTSQGVKDLRLGATAQGEPLPWHADAEHHLIAATLGSEAPNGLAALLGDGLVSVPAAHAASHAPRETEYIAQVHSRLIHGLSHLRLVNDPAVYEHIRTACAGAPGEVSHGPTDD